MLTDEELPPAPRLKFSRWLFGSMITTSLVCGAFGALAVLFLVDNSVLNIGEDPAIADEEFDEKIDRRIKALEEREAGRETNTDYSAMREKLDTAYAETQSLKERIASIQAGEQVENIAARAMIGLTQLKSAYENDLSYQGAIDTLGKLVNDETSKQHLMELQLLNEKGIASKEEILKKIERMKQEKEKPASAEQEKSLTLKERASRALGTLVRVQQADNVEDKKNILRLEQSVQFGNYGSALEIAKDMPNTQALVADLRTRLTAQSLVQRLTAQISNTIGQPGGGLY